MKYYVYILSLFIIVLVISGCRSNRSLHQVSESELHIGIENTTTSTTDSTSSTNKEVEKTNETNTLSQSESEKTVDENKESNEYQEEYELTTIYDKDGNVRATKERGKRSGRTESATSGRRSHDASSGSTSSVDNEKSSEQSETNLISETESHTNIDIQENESSNVDEESNTDSRWIQGWEWLYIIIPIAVIVAIVYLIKRKKK